MKFNIAHTNINVLDLDKSLKFYKEALGLEETKRITSTDGDFIIVYLSDGRQGSHLLELTWLKEKEEAYDLGDNEMHIAFFCDNYEEAYKKHKEMGIICFENPKMGIYFINDPDEYWLEILPSK